MVNTPLFMRVNDLFSEFSSYILEITEVIHLDHNTHYCAYVGEEGKTVLFRNALIAYMG